MADFPALPPDFRAYELPMLATTPSAWPNGSITRRYWSETASGVRLTLEWEHLDATDRQAIEDHWKGQQGTFLPFDLPAAVWCGNSLSSEIDPATTEWRWASAPEIDDRSAGGARVRVELIGIDTTATPITPLAIVPAVSALSFSTALASGYTIAARIPDPTSEVSTRIATLTATSTMSHAFMLSRNLTYSGSARRIKDFLISGPSGAGPWIESGNINPYLYDNAYLYLPRQYGYVFIMLPTGNGNAIAVQFIANYLTGTTTSGAIHLQCMVFGPGGARGIPTPEAFQSAIQQYGTFTYTKNFIGSAMEAFVQLGFTGFATPDTWIDRRVYSPLVYTLLSTGAYNPVADRFDGTMLDDPDDLVVPVPDQYRISGSRGAWRNVYDFDEFNNQLGDAWRDEDFWWGGPTSDPYYFSGNIYWAFGLSNEDCQAIHDNPSIWVDGVNHYTMTQAQHAQGSFPPIPTDPGESGFVELLLYTDWGVPELCRQAAINLGFPESDLQP